MQLPAQILCSALCVAGVLAAPAPSSSTDAGKTTSATSKSSKESTTVASTTSANTGVTSGTATSGTTNPSGTTSASGACWTYDTALNPADSTSERRRSNNPYLEDFDFDAFYMEDPSSLAENATTSSMIKRQVGAATTTLGACTLDTTSNGDAVTLPNYPSAGKLAAQLKNRKSKGPPPGVPGPNEQQIWWTVDSTCAGAPQVKWNNGDTISSGKVSSMKLSSDHVYEKGLVPAYLSSLLGSADAATCASFNNLFVKTADDTWANKVPTIQGDPNKKGQSRLQSLYNLVPNYLNLAFVGVDGGVNSVKGILFNDKLGGAPQVKDTSDDTDTQWNLQQWAAMGMAIDYLKQSVVQQQYQIGNAALLGAYNQFDALWDACEKPVNFGDHYKSYMSTLLSTNVASLVATASAFSSSIEKNAVTADSNGDKNAFYTAFTRLAQTYPPESMTFPTASYLNFPATTDTNIKRTAAACSLSATSTTSSASHTGSTTSGSHTGSSITSGSNTGSTTSGTHTGSTTSGTQTGSGITSSTKAQTSSSITCSVTSLGPLMPKECKCAGHTDMLPTLTGSSLCGYTAYPANPTQVWASNSEFKSQSVTSESASSVTPGPTAFVEMGQDPVLVGLKSGIPAVSSSMNSVLRSACPAPAADGHTTGCAQTTAKVENVNFIDGGEFEIGELVFNLENTQYSSSAMLDGLISAATNAFINSASGKNCANVTYDKDVPTKKRTYTGPDDGPGQQEEPGEILECAATNFLSVQSFAHGLSDLQGWFDAEISFQLKGASDFLCDLIVDAVQTGLDTLAPELEPATALAVGELGACCQGSCNDPGDIIKSVAGSVLPSISLAAVDNKIAGIAATPTTGNKGTSGTAASASVTKTGAN